MASLISDGEKLCLKTAWMNLIDLRLLGSALWGTMGAESSWLNHCSIHSWVASSAFVSCRSAMTHSVLVSRSELIWRQWSDLEQNALSAHPLYDPILGVS